MGKKTAQRDSWRWLRFVLLLALVAGGVLLVRWRVSQRGAVLPPPVRPLPVHTAPVRSGSLTVVERYLGIIEARRPVTVAPRIAGELIRVMVDVGDRVSAGQELARLDARELEARLAAREAELEGARREWRIRQKIRVRLTGLVRRDAAAQQDLDLAVLEFDLAAARVDRLAAEVVQLKTELGYTRLVAAAGVVSERFREPGDHVGAGQPVLAIECPAFGYQVVVEVPAARQPLLHAGTEVELVAGARRMPAVISRRSPAASPRAALGRVEIDLEQAPFGLPSGSRIGVAVQVAAETGSRVPLNALLFTESGVRLFAVDGESRVRPATVTVRAMDDHHAVVEGIAAGKRVVVADEALFLRLHEGMTVAPVVDRGEP